jgi:integrase
MGCSSCQETSSTLAPAPVDLHKARVADERRNSDPPRHPRQVQTIRIRPHTRNVNQRKKNQEEPRLAQCLATSPTESGASSSRASSGSSYRGSVRFASRSCAVLRRALKDDELAANPLDLLDLPAAGRPRERAASPEEAAALLAALSEADRPLWATVFYAGLRRGELRALRWSDIDEGVTEMSGREGLG